MRGPPAPVIDVDSLIVDFWDRRRWTNVVHGVSFHIFPGETLGMAGESGCGKSTTAYALLGYHRPMSRFNGGAVRFLGRDLLRLPARELQKIRGAEIGFVPQNPATALNPSMPVGHQVVESLEAHGACASRREAEDRCLGLFADMGLPRPKVVARRYPHQLSGGQQQRVVLAMALACHPTLLVLDEPTTGLDVTTQARILSLLARLRARYGMAMFYVSHNLGVLAQVCNRITVMYAGELIEVASTAELFRNPGHPYTRGLIASLQQVSGFVGTQPLLRGLLRRDALPLGCRFAPRCEYSQPRCFTSPQSLATVGDGHEVACWRWPDIPAGTDPADKGTV